MNVQIVKKAFADFIHQYGSEAEIVLFKEDTLFRVKVSDVNRIPENITDGLQQNRNIIRILADDWHRQIGAHRKPEKGDQITLAGIHYIIDTARPVQFADTLIGYVATLRG